jgi:uroporphyrin-III C-methyltransferase
MIPHDARRAEGAPSPVHLVGAGPGDPLLLTRRAADLLARADVVVADRASAAPILALAPAAAARHFVGRTESAPAWDLDAVADLLAAAARLGRTVVRLKSGDPFVCSRGAEEALALAARGIRCEVVPGVSAATAAPLAASWPRGRSVTIAAGNLDPCQPPLDLAALADPRATLVVLTGRSRQAALAAGLLAGGLPAMTPAAVVHGATRSGQRVQTSTVEALGRTRLPPPAALLIGPSPEEGHAHP